MSVDGQSCPVHQHPVLTTGDTIIPCGESGELRTREAATSTEAA